MDGHAGRPRRRPALRRSSLWYLVVTRLVVNTAHRFVYPFLPAIARGLGISLEQAGLLLSARSIAFVATPAVVSTVGRGERRLRLTAFGLLLMSAGALITAATGVVAGALIGMFLLGLGKPSFDAAAQSYVADRTPYSRRARYLSILELTWAGGMLIGAPAAGWLISRHGWRAPFWVVAVLLAVAAAVAPRLLEGDAGGTGSRLGRFRPGRPGRALLLTGLLFSMAAETTFIVFGAWLEDGFGLTAAGLGLAAMAVALAELAGEGSVLAFADRLGPRRMVAIGLGASVVGYLGITLASGSLIGGLGAVAAAFVAFEITIVSTVPLASEAEPGGRARFLAWLMVAVGIGRAAGDALGPLLYGWKGLTATGLASALMAGLALLTLLVAVDEPG